MTMLKSLAIWVSILCLAACSDPSQPSEETVIPEFRILAIDEDSLYWDEQTHITAEGLGNNTDSLSLFINTDELRLDSLIGQRLYFTIPRGASSGMLRLYRGDQLAEGEFRLFIWETTIIELNSRAVGLYPGNPRPGDLMRITGHDFPLRRSSLEIELNGNKVEVAAFDSNWIEFHLPDPSEARYEVSLSIAGKVIRGWEVFPDLTPDGELPSSDVARKLRIEMYGVIGLVEARWNDPDSTFISNSPMESIFRRETEVSSFSIETRGDSLFAIHDSSFANGRNKYHLILVKKPGDHVDGVLTVDRRSNIGQSSEEVLELSIRFRDLRWEAHYENSWSFRSFPGRLADALEEFTYFQRFGSQGYQGRLMSWEVSNSSPSSYLILELGPP